MFSFLFGILALAVASNPFILIAVIVLGAVFIVVRWLYVCATRNFKRLEALGTDDNNDDDKLMYTIIIFQLVVQSSPSCLLLFKVFLSFVLTQCSLQL